MFTWVSGPTEHRETVVTVEFREVDGGTEVVLVHEGLPLAAAEPHKAGWGLILTHLTNELDDTADSAAERSAS